jgi:hypothetical protein
MPGRIFEASPGFATIAGHVPFTREMRASRLPIVRSAVSTSKRFCRLSQSCADVPSALPICAFASDSSARIHNFFYPLLRLADFEATCAKRVRQGCHRSIPTHPSPLRLDEILRCKLQFRDLMTGALVEFERSPHDNQGG